MGTKPAMIRTALAFHGGVGQYDEAGYEEQEEGPSWRSTRKSAS
jgi:hypothetical protein